MIDKKQIIKKDFILNYLPKNSSGAEIGVWKGEFSEIIIDKLNPSIIYLVDPWLFMGEIYPDRWYGGTWATCQLDMDSIYESLIKKYENQKNVKIIKDSSVNLLNHIPKKSLDWVYIDGNHDYEFVLNDLRISKELIKSKGMIVGDDFIKDNDIHKALITFAMENPSYNYSTIENQFLIQT